MAESPEQAGADVPAKTPATLGLRTSNRARKSSSNSWWTAEAAAAPTVNKFILELAETSLLAKADRGFPGTSTQALESHIVSGSSTQPCSLEILKFYESP